MITSLSNMELRHLRYFAAVAEHLNFSEASRRIHVAQPAISQTILDLEEELGVRLLLRDRTARFGSRPLAKPSGGKRSKSGVGPKRRFP